MASCEQKRVLLCFFGASNHIFASRKRRRRSSLISHRNLGHLTEESLHVKTASQGQLFLEAVKNKIQPPFPRPTCQPFRHEPLRSPGLPTARSLRSGTCSRGRSPRWQLEPTRRRPSPCCSGVTAPGGAETSRFSPRIP